MYRVHEVLATVCCVMSALLWHICSWKCQNLTVCWAVLLFLVITHLLLTHWYHRFFLVLGKNRNTCSLRTQKYFRLENTGLYKYEQYCVVPVNKANAGFSLSILSFVCIIGAVFFWRYKCSIVCRLLMPCSLRSSFDFINIALPLLHFRATFPVPSCDRFWINMLEGPKIPHSGNK